MRRIESKILFLTAVFVFISMASASAKNISISTGSMGGGFYAIGGGMAEYITKHIEGIRCTAITSGGIDENFRRLDTEKTDIALASTSDSHMAFNGQAPYKKKYNKMRNMGILFSNWGEPYTLKKSGIKTYLDLKGKTVCGAAPGGSMYKFLYDFVRVHGLDPEKDMKTVFLPTRAAIDAIKTGRIDAAMQIAAIPTADITEVSLTHNVEIIRFAPGMREKLMKEKPKYMPMVIPAGTYRGINEDVETVGVAAIWVCRQDLSEDIVYKIVKSFYSPEGLEYIGKVHAAGKKIKLENAANWSSIPFHPGAEKFFREVGLLK